MDASGIAILDAGLQPILPLDRPSGMLNF